MLQYRIFVKDCLDLTNYAIANTICTSFDVSRDLLSDADSNFEVLEIPTNIKEGDILGLIDPYGQIVYTGVIKSIDTGIQTAQMIDIFNDNWLWKNPSGTTIEAKLRSIINSDFINSSDPLIRQKNPYELSVTSSTTGTFKKQETPYVENFKDFLFNIYSTYGVIVDIVVPYGNEAPKMIIKKATHGSMKIGNNIVSVRDMTPFTEIFETNKLVIYNNEGTTLRGTYYGTKDGITTDSSDPLRLPVVNTEYIFNTDDNLSDIVQEQLQEKMLNHRITFNLILDNNLLNFYDWELGMPMEIWYNQQYFSTIYTGYSMIQPENEDIASVEITCGKVRNKLTEILNGRQ